MEFAATTISRISIRRCRCKERDRVMAPTKREDGIPPNQIEYKIRRMVNDYLQPPKVTRKFELGRAGFAEVREDMEQRMIARNSHELLRALETHSILDCADMAATPRCIRPKAAGASTTCVPISRRRTTRTGSATRCFPKPRTAP
jgi:succinate dehydrogenase/fumarate reductase flavoprotein subunit